MRDVLLKRVRPLVDRLAEDMADLAVRRVEAELERMTEAFDVALSAFASEETNGNPDRRDHDPVPRVRRRARRGLQGDGARDELRVGGGQDTQQPAQAPDARRPEGERAARLVEASASAPRVRSDGKRIGTIVCSICGFVGGNKRGCGTAHETVVGGAEDLLDEPAERDAKPSNVTKQDRFARIEAAAAARRNGVAG